MNQSMQPAIQHLFQVSSLDAVSREQLESFVEDHPCFGFGHYLLSLKLRAGNPEQFLAATQKTSLYFPNPFWLQWMLVNTPEPAATYIPAPEVLLHAEPPFVPAEPLVSSGPWPEMESPETPAETTALYPDPEAAAELLFESIESARVLRESIQKINQDFQSHNGQLAPTEEPIRDEEPPYVLEEPDQPAQALEAVYIEPSPVMANSPALSVTDSYTAPVADPPPPIPATESVPLFEPLHTIDYFASQGIRLTLDENPTDPLGRQLKSFTDWLRTMRRLPQKDREIIPDRAAEQNIQNIAAHSIEGKEPITETMAEVLAKQGMPERARIVYEKLGLLNPEKSAYFATKIEQLNIH
jgi:hypothetical protein